MEISELNKEELSKVSGGRKDREKQVAHIDNSQCVLCGSCVDVCEKKAISVEMDETSHDDKYVVNAGRCDGCGACRHECPADCITIS